MFDSDDSDSEIVSKFYKNAPKVATTSIGSTNTNTPTRTTETSTTAITSTTSTTTTSSASSSSLRASNSVVVPTKSVSQMTPSSSSSSSVTKNKLTISNKRLVDSDDEDSLVDKHKPAKKHKTTQAKKSSIFIDSEAEEFDDENDDEDDFEDDEDNGLSGAGDTEDIANEGSIELENDDEDDNEEELDSDIDSDDPDKDRKLHELEVKRKISTLKLNRKHISQKEESVCYGSKATMEIIKQDQAKVKLILAKREKGELFSELGMFVDTRMKRNKNTEFDDEFWKGFIAFLLEKRTYYGSIDQVKEYMFSLMNEQLQEPNNIKRLNQKYKEMKKKRKSATPKVLWSELKKQYWPNNASVNWYHLAMVCSDYQVGESLENCEIISEDDEATLSDFIDLYPDDDSFEGMMEFYKEGYSKYFKTQGRSAKYIDSFTSELEATFEKCSNIINSYNKTDNAKQILSRKKRLEFILLEHASPNMFKQYPGFEQYKKKIDIQVLTFFNSKFFVRSPWQSEDEFDRVNPFGKTPSKVKDYINKSKYAEITTDGHLSHMSKNLGAGAYNDAIETLSIGEEEAETKAGPTTVVDEQAIDDATMELCDAAFDNRTKAAKSERRMNNLTKQTWDKGAKPNEQKLKEVLGISGDKSSDNEELSHASEFDEDEDCDEDDGSVDDDDSEQENEDSDISEGDDDDDLNDGDEGETFNKLVNEHFGDDDTEKVTKGEKKKKQGERKANAGKDRLSKSKEKKPRRQSVKKNDTPPGLGKEFCKLKKVYRFTYLGSPGKARNVRLRAESLSPSNLYTIKCKSNNEYLFAFIKDGSNVINIINETSAIGLFDKLFGLELSKHNEDIVSDLKKWIETWLAYSNKEPVVEVNDKITQKFFPCNDEVVTKYGSKYYYVDKAQEWLEKFKSQRVIDFKDDQKPHRGSQSVSTTTSSYSSLSKHKKEPEFVTKLKSYMKAGFTSMMKNGIPEEKIRKLKILQDLSEQCKDKDPLANFNFLNKMLISKNCKGLENLVLFLPLYDETLFTGSNEH